MRRSRRPVGRRPAVLVALALCAAACGGGASALPTASPGPQAATDPAPMASSPPEAPTPVPTPGVTAATTPQSSPEAPTPGPTPRVTGATTPDSSPASPLVPAGTARTAPPPPVRPAWLGTRPLPLRPDGFGVVLDTPDELVERSLPPPSPPVLPPPAGEDFEATVQPVPAEVVARSTWSPECPVGLDDLRYVTMSFWGFDGRAHTGEMLVHGAAAGDLVEVFRTLFDERFPIEEMRVTGPAELDAPPTGDGNNTTAFVCRPVRGSSTWSQHAHGLAVDVNPFHNPYVRGDLVLPELASAYADRARHRPGMVQPGDAVTAAFAAIGWGWGGDWTGLTDPMHFSSTGR